VNFTFNLHVLLLLFHKLSEINASIALEMDCCFGDSDVRDDIVVSVYHKIGDYTLLLEGVTGGGNATSTSSSNRYRCTIIVCLGGAERRAGVCASFRTPLGLGQANLYVCI
jgi:hypothetical protein